MSANYTDVIKRAVYAALGCTTTRAKRGEDICKVFDAAAEQIARFVTNELATAGYEITPKLTQENCPHKDRDGMGTIGTDGAGHMKWTCRTCGKTHEAEWPARSREFA